MLKLIYRIFLWQTYCADNGRTNITQHRKNVSTCFEGNLPQPIKSSNQIWVMTRHQYVICALVPQVSFSGETAVGAWRREMSVVFSRNVYPRGELFSRMKTTRAS